MLTRALSGAVFVIVVIGSILLHHISFLCLLVFVNAMGLHELFKNVKQQGRASLRGLDQNLLIVSSSALVIYAMQHFTGGDSKSIYLIPAMFFAVFLRGIFIKLENGINTFAYMALGMVYVSLPMFMLVHWAQIGDDYVTTYLIGGLVLIWTNDTFAYLTGKLLGKHKLIERVSPNKTWEGTIGGFVFAILAALIYAYFSDQPLVPWAGFGLVCGLCATLGDLIESVIKRSLGVKDMGNLMPGHGGVLDRFDALLFAAPFGAAYIQWVFV